ncbi:MAG: hypothetical protein IJ335_06890, partial [Lachnospiraceae bacterium]|nr:hypothetical protein [Lachnospiraceae bacterium]
CGLFFIGLGIYDICSKNQLPFCIWSNEETEPMRDVKGHNRAVGILWCIYGIVFMLLGLPLMTGQNSPYIIISILGVAFESLVAMAVYVVVIENKYKK